MTECVQRRVRNIPEIAFSNEGQALFHGEEDQIVANETCNEDASVQVLFSGGLDSSLLAAILA